TDHQGIGSGVALQTGRQIGGLTERQLFLPGATPHLPHHHPPGMDPYAPGQAHTAFPRQASTQLAQGLDHPQPSTYGALGVVFMGQRVAEVDQQAIAEILRDMALEAGDHLGTGRLIGPHDLAQVFRIELTRQARRVHQVTKQHRELAAFSLRGRWWGWGGFSLERVDIVRGKWLYRLGRWGAGHRWHVSTTRPDQDAPLLITGHLLCVEEFVLEIVESVLA